METGGKATVKTYNVEESEVPEVAPSLAVIQQMIQVVVSVAFYEWEPVLPIKKPRLETFYPC